jgi:hypothetical protein
MTLNGGGLASLAVGNDVVRCRVMISLYRAITPPSAQWPKLLCPGAGRSEALCPFEQMEHSATGGV